MKALEEEKDKALEEKFQASESFKKSILDKNAPANNRDYRPQDGGKKDFKDCVGLKPAIISIESSPEDVELWANSARLYASASNMDVLKNEDQRVLSLIHI